MALKLKKQIDNQNELFASEKKTVNKESDILKGLNQKQADAVKTINGPLLVIAGAGSGKTRVLTHRTAHLIENGVAPWNILALTFTNKAAREMVERISSILSPDQAKAIWAGTFHSIFARILRIEAENLGYSSSFSIYDTDDTQRLIKNIIKSMGLSPKEHSPQSVRSKISWAKNQMITPRKMEQEASSSTDKYAARIYFEYEKQMKVNNAMDFDDLLINFIALLKSKEEILQKYQEKFKYILVDEYQDTNRAQYIAVNMLAAKYRNLCVVGDDAQSIYKWRGADIRNILDFQNDYKDAQIIRLEQNYRSTKTILQAADSVIKNNKRQISKKLWTDNPDGEVIELFACTDERFEAEKIAELIKSKLGSNYSARDIAVLYRTNAQSLAIENALRHIKLPYNIIGGMSFYKRKEVKDALSYIRLLLNPQDNESVLRVLNEPPRGIGQVSINHLQKYAADTGISLLAAFERAEEVPKLQKRAAKSAMKFAEMIKKYILNEENLSIAKQITSFIEETGLLDMYQEIGTEDALDRWNNIQQLLSDISLYFRKDPEATLDDYLSQSSLATDMDEADSDKNKITLMTLHSAKGLEFPIVVIAGLEQGLFPLGKADQIPEEEEEERRLFYVGITRAEEKLYLTYSKRRMRFGEISMQSPSRFIDEIQPDLLKTTGTNRIQSTINNMKRESASRPVTKKYVNNTVSSKPVVVEQTQYRVGDKVKHSHFGIGKITGLSGAGDKRQAVILFPDIGKKRLMLKFAKLTKLDY